MNIGEKRRFEKIKQEIFKQVKISPDIPVWLKPNDFDFFARANSGIDKPFQGDECRLGKIVIKRAPRTYAEM